MSFQEHTKRLAVSLIVSALVATNLPFAHAETPVATTFAVALPGDTSTTIKSHSTSAATATTTSSAIIIATSDSGRSTLAEIHVTPSLTAFALRDVDNKVTLLPKSLSTAEVDFYPTDRGLVIDSGTAYSYISTSDLVAGRAATVLGGVPAAAAGYSREILSVTALDGGVYVSTVDTQLGTTEPELGQGHIWFIQNGHPAVDSLTISGGYIASLSLDPSSALSGKALVVYLGDITTSDLMSISVNSVSHLIALVGSPTYAELDSDVIDQYIAWGAAGSSYLPLVVRVRSEETNVEDQNGTVLTSYPADTALLMAPNATVFTYTSSAANLIRTTARFSAKLSAVYTYGKKITAKLIVASSGSGYSLTPTGKLTVVAAGKTTTLTSKGHIAKANFCINGIVKASAYVAGTTVKSCAKVSHNLVAKTKKRVVTLTTTATKVTVKLQVIKKKKITWVSAPVKVTVKKGAAKVTFKKAGTYRFIAAATKNNAELTSGNIKIK